MGKINLSNIQASLNRAKETAAPLQNKGHTENVPVDFIHLAESNVYNENDTDESIKELADNIEACGLLHPIAVHKISSYHYQIISGERRYRAITEYLHWKSIPCMVFEGLSKDSAQLKLYMANLAVREYTSGQRFKYYMEVKELLGRMAKSGEYSGGLQKGIAELLNVTERQVKKYAQLEKMPQEIQQAVIEGKLSINKALEMAAKSQEQVKVKKQTEEIIGNIIERLSDAQKKKLLYGEIDFSRLFDNDNLLSKGEPVPLDVAVTSPKIKTSEKRESVPLDIATTSPESETSEKREPVPLDIVATSPEIETSEKGEPVPIDIATTSPKIKTSEKREPVPLDIAATSPKSEIAKKREPVPPNIDKTTSDNKLFKSLQDDSVIFYKNGHYVPNKIQVMEEHEQYTVFKVFAVKQ